MKRISNKVYRVMTAFICFAFKKENNGHQLYSVTIGSTTVDLLVDSGLLDEIIFNKLQPKPTIKGSKINI